MEFKITEHSSCAVIELGGNVMGGPDAVHLNRKLHELIDKDQTNIVADVSKIELMNSSGLGMLIGGLITLRKAGGDLRIANPTDKIKSLLDVTKLVTVFKQFESVDEAVASYQNQDEV